MLTINEFESHENDLNRYMFDPSDFYNLEVLRFKTRHSGMRDKV